MTTLSHPSTDLPRTWSDLGLYRYRGLVVGLYDGDSATVDLDLGLGVWLRGQKIRVFGIDTPELRGDEREAGLAAKARALEILGAAERDLELEPVEIVLETIRDSRGKYGRWLARIWIETSKGWVDLGATLTEEGFADPYFGGKR